MRKTKYRYLKKKEIRSNTDSHSVTSNDTHRKNVYPRRHMHRRRKCNWIEATTTISSGGSKISARRVKTSHLGSARKNEMFLRAEPRYDFLAPTRRYAKIPASAWMTWRITHTHTHIRGEAYTIIKHIDEKLTLFALLYLLFSFYLSLRIAIRVHIPPTFSFFK